jgi:membrane protein CcdC involved in cytochrome C biogenesis
LATRSPSWNAQFGNVSREENLDKFYLGTVTFSLLFTTSLFELHATHVHYRGSDSVDVVLLLLGETQNVEGLLLT